MQANASDNHLPAISSKRCSISSFIGCDVEIACLFYNYNMCTYYCSKPYKSLRLSSHRKCQQLNKQPSMICTAHDFRHSATFDRQFHPSIVPSIRLFYWSRQFSPLATNGHSALEKKFKYDSLVHKAIVVFY